LQYSSEPIRNNQIAHTHNKDRWLTSNS